MSGDLAAAVVSAGQLLLQFARVPRITFHEDGKRTETDADHTVMLGVLACAIAASYEPRLDVGLVGQFALVHDLVEVHAGDTNTLVGYDAAARTMKEAREWAALQLIRKEFAETLPWIAEVIERYERRDTPEARFVKALDKLLPKITHELNRLMTIRRQPGMTAQQLRHRYEDQAVELAAYAGDFPTLMRLREDLVARVMVLAEQVLPGEDETGHDTKETV